MESIMRRTLLVLIILFLSALSLPLVAGPAAAHSPTFPGNNTSLANATLVEDPSKSWAIYDHLEEATVQCYALDLKSGDRLFLSLIVPTHEKGTGFQPEMVILGPFSDKNGTVPSTIELPAGYGWNVVNSTIPEKPTYEAFSPSAFLNLATYDDHVTTDGRYFVVVFQDPGLPVIHGDYGLAVGYMESFTIAEYVLIPFSLLNVYQWEGQSLLQVFAPMVAVFLVGLLALYLWRKESFAEMGVANGFALVSGLLFLGTATNTIIQTIISISQTGVVAEVLVTLMFIVATLLLGWFALQIALAGRSPLTNRQRMEVFAIGLIGLFVWGGLLIGPIIAMVGSVLPGGRR
jgi:hypothetical protein